MRNPTTSFADLLRPSIRPHTPSVYLDHRTPRVYCHISAAAAGSFPMCRRLIMGSSIHPRGVTLGDVPSCLVNQVPPRYNVVQDHRLDRREVDCTCLLVNNHVPGSHCLPLAIEACLNDCWFDLITSCYLDNCCLSYISYLRIRYGQLTYTTLYKLFH